MAKIKHNLCTHVREKTSVSLRTNFATLREWEVDVFILPPWKKILVLQYEIKL